MSTPTLVMLTPAFPYRGGIAASSERLAYEFQKEGYKVIIYTFTLQYPDFLFPGKTQYAEGPAPEGLEIKRVLNSINPFNWLQVGNEIRGLNPDIVVTRFWIPFMGPSLGTVLRQVRKNKQTKVIAIVDNIIPHEKRIGDRQLSNYFLGSVDGCIVMSKSVGEEIQSFSNNKPVRFIPHPIYDNYGKAVSRDKALTYLGLDHASRYLLFFGFIRDYKGLDLLLKAMADKRIRELGIKLIVAGEYYSNQLYYEELIEKGGIEDLVELRTDYIPNEEVLYYFCAADLIVQPYRTATQSGISQLAYYYEKPMVATKVGGLPEIIEDGESGYIVEISKKAIANAIIDFYENDRAKDFVKAVRRNKKRFSWANMVKAIEQLSINEKTPVD